MRYLNIRFVPAGEPVPKTSHIYIGKIPDDEFKRICEWASGRLPKFGRSTRRLRIVIIVPADKSVEEPEK